jgi:serine/threonine protein kinase
MDAHRASVIHKDIKCDNIVLEQDELDLGAMTLLRGVVCDFGLANVATQVQCLHGSSFRNTFSVLIFPLTSCSRVILQSAARVNSSRPRYGSISIGRLPVTKTVHIKPPATFIRWG